MKKFLSLLLLLSTSVFAVEVRLIDKDALLTEVHKSLESKSLSDFKKGDTAKILVADIKMASMKVESASDKKVTISGTKKLVITPESFKEAKNSLMTVILQNSSSKVTVNGRVYENTYVVSSVTPVEHVLDDGTRYASHEVVLSSADVLSSGGWGMFGSEPLLTLKFVVSAEAPAVAQVLKVTANGQVAYDVRAVSVK